MRPCWVFGSLVLLLVRCTLGIDSLNLTETETETVFDGEKVLRQTASLRPPHSHSSCRRQWSFLPGYHLHRGFGSGADSWLVQLEVANLSVVANLTPRSDHNQSPRNMYQCQMAKQTMGFGRLRFGRRWPFILAGCITICCSVFLSLSLTVTLTCAKEVPLSELDPTYAWQKKSGLSSVLKTFKNLPVECSLCFL